MFMLSELNRKNEFVCPLKDLRQNYGEIVLLNTCLEAVQSLNLTSAELEDLKVGNFRPQMMLTLLTYAYASQIYSSENLEWATLHDDTIRYICARTNPSIKSIRQFRKLNRPHLERCLSFVIEKIWRATFCPVESDYAFYSWFESRLQYLAQSDARERIEFAVMTDTVAFEW